MGTLQGLGLGRAQQVLSTDGSSRPCLHPAGGCRALGAGHPGEGQEGLRAGRLGGCQDRRLWTFRAGHPGRRQPLRPPSAGLERSENRQNSKMPTKGLPVDTSRLRLLSPPHPVSAPWPCRTPGGTARPREESPPTGPQPYHLFFKKLGLKSRSCLTGTRAGPPASSLQTSCCGHGGTLRTSLLSELNPHRPPRAHTRVHTHPHTMHTYTHNAHT